MRNHEDKIAKEYVPSSRSVIAKLERTQSNAQQNIEQLQSPTMGVTLINESTTTEPLP